MKNRASYWLAGAFFLSAPLSAAEIKSPLPHITTGTLPNGLHYTLVPLEGQKQRVDIRLAVEAGSVDETDAQSGVAHMVEHMVFRASEAYPSGVANMLHQKGWIRAQHYNAMTNYERTQYMMSPPAGKRDLPLALAALSQMVGHASLRQSDLDDERKIILEEWRGKLGVAERMNQQRVQAIRQGSRYPDRPVIGTESSITRMPATQLQDFYQRWYHPSNMRLMVIGDIVSQEVAAEITRQFGALPNARLPARHYYEPHLKKQLNVVRLQDSESGASQIAFVFRLNDPQSKKIGLEGMRHRLLDQLATNALQRQLRRQSEHLPDSVNSLVVRKSDIGKTTVAVGFFADVIPGEHQAALPVLLQEIERVKRYPLSERDIVELKNDIRQAANRMVASAESREFSDWVQQLSVTWLQNKPYVSTQQIGRDALTLLPTITPQDVNHHLQRWLAASDTLVQFSVPGDAPFTLPTVTAITTELQKADAVNLAPAPLPSAKIVPELPDVTAAGKRTAVQHFPQQQVEQWQLANGDRVVYLRTPLAHDKFYLSAYSNAGFMAKTLNPWQAQIASQIVAQSGPQGWRAENLRDWKQAQSVSFNVSQSADELQMTGMASLKQAQSLFQLYHAMNTQAGVDASVMKDSLASLMRQRANRSQSAGDLRQREITRLRFGQPAYQEPTQEQLRALTATALLTQWQQTVSAPVTYYLMANQPAETFLPLVERYLASLPRATQPAIASHRALAGTREATVALNIEPRSEVRAWSYTEQPWTPQAAVQVSIARNLANKYLKNSLRDEALGIYRMRLDSALADKAQRIETEISFSASPERGHELWQRAEQVLASLPQRITADDVEQQRQQFIRAEQGRNNDFTTQQRRLILSDRHYGDPRYLSEVTNLAQAVTLDGVRAMAAKLLNPTNRVLLLSLPREGAETEDSTADVALQGDAAL